MGLHHSMTGCNFTTRGSARAATTGYQPTNQILDCVHTPRSTNSIKFARYLCRTTYVYICMQTCEEQAQITHYIFIPNVHSYIRITHGHACIAEHAASITRTLRVPAAAVLHRLPCLLFSLDLTQRQKQAKAAGLLQMHKCKRFTYISRQIFDHHAFS